MYSLLEKFCLLCLTTLTSNVSLSPSTCYGARFRRSFAQTYLIQYDIKKLRRLKNFEIFIYNFMIDQEDLKHF